MNRWKKVSGLVLLLNYASGICAMQANFPFEYMKQARTYSFTFRGEERTITRDQAIAIAQVPRIHSLIEDQANDDEGPFYAEEDQILKYNFNTIFGRANFVRWLAIDDIFRFIQAVEALFIMDLTTQTTSDVGAEEAQALIAGPLGERFNQATDRLIYFGENLPIPQLANIFLISNFLEVENLLGNLNLPERIASLLEQHFSGQETGIAELLATIPEHALLEHVDPHEFDTFALGVIQTGKPFYTLRAWKGQYAFTITPRREMDPRRQASITGLRELRLWDLRRLESLQTHNLPTEANPFGSAFLVEAFLPDGRVVRDHRFNTVQILHPDTGQTELIRPSADNATTFHVTAMPPTRVATSSPDDLIRIWNIDTKEEVGAINRRGTFQKKFLPENRLAVAQEGAHEITVWDISDLSEGPLEEPDATLDWPNHQLDISHPFGLHENYLIAQSNDRKIAIWNLETGELATSFDGFRPTILPGGKLAYLAPERERWSITIRNLHPHFDAVIPRVGMTTTENTSLMAFPGNEWLLLKKTRRHAQPGYRIELCDLRHPTRRCRMLHEPSSDQVVTLDGNRFAYVESLPLKLVVGQVFPDASFEEQLVLTFLNKHTAETDPLTPQTYPVLYETLQRVRPEIVSVLVNFKRIVPFRPAAPKPRRRRRRRAGPPPTAGPADPATPTAQVLPTTPERVQAPAAQPVAQEEFTQAFDQMKQARTADDVLRHRDAAMSVLRQLRETNEPFAQQLLQQLKDSYWQQTRRLAQTTYGPDWKRFQDEERKLRNNPFATELSEEQEQEAQRIIQDVTKLSPQRGTKLQQQFDQIKTFFEQRKREFGEVPAGRNPFD